MKRTDIQTIFARFELENPKPTTELSYKTPYQLLVAVVLSAQMTDKGVNRATVPLFEKAPTPEAMISLEQTELEEALKSINYYRVKAKNVKALSHMLLERHAGEVPCDRAALEALPGVGRKTANVVLNTIFGLPTMAVDTHIFRVANRTGLAPGKDVLEVETALLKRVPKAYLLNAHHWLILHGRYVCTARAPHCVQCSISDLCQFKEKNL
jgi:endonuclease-3